MKRYIIGLTLASALTMGPTGYFTYGRGYAMFDDATGTLTFSYKGFKPVTYYYVLFEGGEYS